MSICMDGCLDVVSCFQIATPPTVFVRFSQNSAHMFYMPVRTNCKNIFFLWKFSFCNFWQFFEILHLDFVSAVAAA